jgi:hypothetical protein
LGFGCFVLQDVPVLGETAVLHPDDVGSDQRRRLAVSREAPVQDDVIAVGHNDGVLVTQRIGQAPHEIKQAIATGLDMGAVLDVILRPEARCGLVVTLVEQGVESFQHKRLVLFCCGLHNAGECAFDRYCGSVHIIFHLDVG